MARIRTVKPEFFRHELLQDLEVTYPGKCPMLVFSGLFGHCDKAGRFEWRPRTLKLDILPFLSFDMAETLAILEKAGLIKKYTVDGSDYGIIPTFTEHQRIQGKEAYEPEKYPPPPWETSGKQQGINGETTGNQSGMQEGKGREGNKEGKKNNVGLKPDALQVLKFLNEKTGKHFEPCDANLELIVARLKEGASVDDCRAIVAKKCRDWSADEKMSQYLRPATLFNRTKFAQYRGELST